MISGLINFIETSIRLYVMYESLDYSHDYNYYIDDLPMTYLVLKEGYFYEHFYDARACDMYYDFHGLFTDYSLSILISYNRDEFIDEDYVYNTIFLFYINHTY